jgi:membrane associated rhomboid family serine protease
MVSMTDPRDPPSSRAFGEPDPAAPRPPLAGPPPRQPAFNAPPVTVVLVLAILGVFAVLRLAPARLSQTLVIELSLIPDRVWLALADPLSGTGLLAAVNLVSHAFVHWDLIHVAANVGFLLAFGSLVERAAGPVKFGAVFVLSAVAGALIQLLFAGDGFSLMFGASGGVSGAMGAAVRLMLADRLDAQRRRLGLNLILALVGLNLLFALFGGAIMGLDAGVAWQAHLGGFAAGFLMLRPGAAGPPRAAAA